MKYIHIYIHYNIIFSNKQDNDIIKAILLDSLYYNVSTNVSSRHLKMHTQFRLIVKNELVAK